MSKPVRRSPLRHSFTGRFCAPTPTISEPDNPPIRQPGNPAICELRNRANAHTGCRPGFPRGDAVGNGSAGQVVELALYLGLLGENVVQLLCYGG